MALPEYRFQLDQLVHISVPQAFVCEKNHTRLSSDLKAWICPGADKCVKESHSVCVVTPKPILERITTDLRLDALVRIGDVDWLSTTDLVVCGSAMVPANDPAEVTRAFEVAFTFDAESLETQTIFAQVGTHWDERNYGVAPTDPISPEVGNLTIRQLLDLYVDEESGRVDFGDLTTLKDIANKCVGESASIVADPSVGEKPESDLERRLADLEARFAQHVKDAEKTKFEIVTQVNMLGDEVRQCNNQIEDNEVRLDDLDFQVEKLNEEFADL